MPEVIYKVDLPAFTGRNVPIKEIASAIGKDAQYVRLGLQQGILKFGTAIKVDMRFSMASVVAPHPVLPLLKMQFSGNLLLSSGIC